jgi:hypothetical protein
LVIEKMAVKDGHAPDYGVSETGLTDFPPVRANRKALPPRWPRQ